MIPHRIKRGVLRAFSVCKTARPSLNCKLCLWWGHILPIFRSPDRYNFFSRWKSSRKSFQTNCVSNLLLNENDANFFLFTKKAGDLRIIDTAIVEKPLRQRGTKKVPSLDIYKKSILAWARNIYDKKNCNVPSLYSNQRFIYTRCLFHFVVSNFSDGAQGQSVCFLYISIHFSQLQAKKASLKKTNELTERKNSNQNDIQLFSFVPRFVSFTRS